MTKETIIPTGYRITIESSENDADNYKTKVMEGLRKESVEFLVDFANLFYNHGNMCDPEENELESFHKDCEIVVGLHINENFENKLLQYFYDDIENKFYEDQYDSVMELAYDLGLSGGKFYTRVVESIKVEYIHTEIVLQDVTEEFV